MNRVDGVGVRRAIATTLVLIACIAVLAVTGCAKSPEQSLLGKKWVRTNELKFSIVAPVKSLEFLKDETGVIVQDGLGDRDFTWTADGTQREKPVLVMTDSGGSGKSVTYYFAVENGILKISDDAAMDPKVTLTFAREGSKEAIAANKKFVDAEAKAEAEEKNEENALLCESNRGDISGTWGRWLENEIGKVKRDAYGTRPPTEISKIEEKAVEMFPTGMSLIDVANKLGTLSDSEGDYSMVKTPEEYECPSGGKIAVKTVNKAYRTIEFECSIHKTEQ